MERLASLAMAAKGQGRPWDQMIDVLRTGKAGVFSVRSLMRWWTRRRRESARTSNV